MAFELERLVRENIRKLVPYSSARSEFTGHAGVFLDANENSFGSPLDTNYNRYPDPLQIEIKDRIAEMYGIGRGEIFVGNGSDEAIDLLFRIFCRPRIDNVIICPPTYGMYEVVANINDVPVRRSNLTNEFKLDTVAVQDSINANTKLIFLCSPNNPTGNLMDRNSILDFAGSFRGIVVADEAYIHFSDEPSLVYEINGLPNLVVLQTFSKAWGMAGLRVGLAFANERIIELFNKVKPPYNVSKPAQELIRTAIRNQTTMHETVAKIVDERKWMAANLDIYSFVVKVFPSEANFLLVKTRNVSEVYNSLLDEGIVVRNRSNITLCEGCLRITIGTPEENQALLAALTKYEESIVH